MRVALCQINPVVGDLEGNAERIVRDVARGQAEQADLVVFPELAVCGYPPRDLLDRDPFVRQVREVLDATAARMPADLAVLVGFVDRVEQPGGPVLYNAAALMRGGRVERVIHKRLLPTYDVFDEDRYFEPGRASAPMEVAGVRVGVTVCEDIWNDADTPIAVRRYGDNPVADLKDAGAEVIVNLSASPFTRPKRLGRPDMLRGVARRHGLPVVFVNQVGGNDDLIFDGDSSIHGPDGQPWTRLARFEEDFACVDLAPGGPVRARAQSDEGASLAALRLGVRDYARKCGFEGVVLGLSGGIDSALTAAIAAEALGPERVLGVAMPTRYSSEHSLRDAEALARASGIAYRCIPIDGIFQRYMDDLASHLEALAPAPQDDVTFENVQSRIRCAVLMAISNRTGRLLLTTGNKSEMAVGYTTLYGDLAGGLAPVSDVPKTFVYALAREVNRAAGEEVIPESTLTKPPSAELREDQQDEDSLPAYEVLDAILARFVEEGQSADAIVAAGFDPEVVTRVLRLVRASEYKRRQMPPGLILSRKAFGPGRRYPIAQRYRG